MKKAVVILSLVLGISISLEAQKSEVFVRENEAIQGYDPVSYFTEGKAVKGKKEFSFNYKSADWHFASLQNLNLFKANPEKYEPQYGGYCAYGLANGHKAPTEPDAWSIIDGKLYFNYNKDVQAIWKKNQKKYIATADGQWPVLKHKE